MFGQRNGIFCMFYSDSNLKQNEIQTLLAVMSNNTIVFFRLVCYRRQTAFSLYVLHVCCLAIYLSNAATGMCLAFAGSFLMLMKWDRFVSTSTR